MGTFAVCLTYPPIICNKSSKFVKPFNNNNNNNSNDNKLIGY